jgi:hypothetical protein
VRQPTLPKISQSYLVAPRIDAAQPFNCRNWRKTTIYVAGPTTKVSGNAGCPGVKIKDRDITTLKVLQIETIKMATFHQESCI